MSVRRPTPRAFGWVHPVVGDGVPKVGKSDHQDAQPSRDQPSHPGPLRDKWAGRRRHGRSWGVTWLDRHGGLPSCTCGSRRMRDCPGDRWCRGCRYSPAASPQDQVRPQAVGKTCSRGSLFTAYDHSVLVVVGNNACGDYVRLVVGILLVCSPMVIWTPDEPPVMAPPSLASRGTSTVTPMAASVLAESESSSAAIEVSLIAEGSGQGGPRSELGRRQTRLGLPSSSLESDKIS